jgi:hypothetical protein
MRKNLLTVFACLAIAAAAQAAPPLVAGQIVVAGFAYPGPPPGVCADRLCTVDAALTTVVSISAPLPFAGRSVLDIAIENPSSIVVLAGYSNPDPEFFLPLGAVLHVDVATGAVTTLASGFEILPHASIATGPGGRIFVNGSAGILEIDRNSGAASVFVPGYFMGVDTENGRTSLVAGENCEEFQCAYTFVRIDLATGLVTPLGPANDYVTEIDVRPAGDLLVFTRPGYTFDGLTYVWSPTTPNFWVNEGETWQALTGGIASDLDGNALVAADGTIDESGFDELELTRFSATGFHEVLAELDADFGLSAIDVTPAFTACSNGEDDDADGAIDYPADPGCRGPRYGKESPQCSDGLDNDGDGGIDFDGGGTGAPDLQCSVAWHDREMSSGGCGLGAELALVFGLLIARRRGRT